MNTLGVPPLALEPLTVRQAHEMFAVLRDPAIYEFENDPPAPPEALSRRDAAVMTTKTS